MNGYRTLFRYYWTFILGLIEDKGSSREQKDGAIEALWGMFEDLIFLSTEKKTISRIFNHDMIMQFIFDGLESEDEFHHHTYGHLITLILKHSSISDRIALIIRYFYKLRSAIISILSRDVVEAYEIRDGFFMSIEMAGVVATLPSELYKWAISGGTFDTQYECLFNVLESSIDSPKTMERLLGYGLLSVSHEYAHLPIDQSTVRHAHVFRAILLMHPEYRQVFRRWTSDGVMGNLTADYGRTIPPRLANVGINYVFVDEDTEI